MSKLLLALFLCLLCGCSVNSAKKHYLTGERLWSDGNYQAAVSEFDRAFELDPKGKMGLHALYRSANTESLFLNHSEEALKKFRQYVQFDSDSPTGQDSQIKIGDLLFLKLEKYKEAIVHYEGLLKATPQNAANPEFYFRIAKSRFYLKNFSEAIHDYLEIERKFPQTAWAEKASFEAANTFYTRGENHQEAFDRFQKFLQKYPKSDLAIQARFNMAGCLEEMDQLDSASRAYESLRGTYPSPQVIEIKLARIRERRLQKNR